MPLKDNWVYRASDLVAGFAIGAVAVLTQDLLMPRSLGLLGGDINTAVIGKKVAALGDLAQSLLYGWPGQRMTLTIYRERRSVPIELVLQAMH